LRHDWPEGPDGVVTRLFFGFTVVQQHIPELTAGKQVMTDTIAERPVSQALRFTAAGVLQMLVLITTIA
jgi:hypothetical protein